MSERSIVISRLLKNRSTREAYIGAKLKVLIPSQIRALRLKSQTPRQEDLANAAEMKQSRISAVETPGAVNFNLETLVRLAAALRVGLQVKFVSFSQMLDWENSFFQDEFKVRTLDTDTVFLGTPQEPSTVEIVGQAAAAAMIGGTFNSPKRGIGGDTNINPNLPGGTNLYEAVSRNTGQSASIH
jgi:transcriptional regulator with XRE-family HTH domain